MTIKVTAARNVLELVIEDNMVETLDLGIASRYARAVVRHAGPAAGEWNTQSVGVQRLTKQRVLVRLKELDEDIGWLALD